MTGAGIVEQVAEANLADSTGQELHDLRRELAGERYQRQKAEAAAAEMRRVLEEFLEVHAGQCETAPKSCRHYAEARSVIQNNTAGDLALEALIRARRAIAAAIPCLQDWANATTHGRLFKRDEDALNQLKSALMALERAA
jgi:hypothetical protein